MIPADPEYESVYKKSKCVQSGVLLAGYTHIVTSCFWFEDGSFTGDHLFHAVNHLSIVAFVETDWPVNKWKKVAARKVKKVLENGFFV